VQRRLLKEYSLWDLEIRPGVHTGEVNTTDEKVRGIAVSAGTSIGFRSKTSTFAELLIDCEEDRTQRAVLIGM
jgi:hypothetical protein